jgi:hypothetical protein
LLLSETETDIFHPRTYTRHMDEGKLRLMLKQQNPPQPVDTLVVDPEVRAIFRRAADYLSARGIEYILVLDPLQPLLENYRAGYRQGLTDASRSLGGLDVLDLSGVLPAEYFVDQLHPDANGARVVTARMARYLKGRR